jgi:filamentous hemagglutinin
MSAANMDLNVQTLNQIGGALQTLNTDGSLNTSGTATIVAQIQAQLGGSFTQTTVSDDLNTHFVKEGGSFGLLQIGALVAAVVASVVTYGAASAAIGAAAGATTSTFAAGTATAAAGLSNVALSSAFAAVASSAASQLVSTGGINLGQLGESAFVAGITAGLLNGISYTSARGLELQHRRSIDE